MTKLYWYELIHRPISLNTQPTGFIEMNRDHVNRNGFSFGKVAYDYPLTDKEMNNYQLEPVHIDGLTEISLIDKEVLVANHIRLTIGLLNYLVESNCIATVRSGTWTYINLTDLKEYADDNFKELKNIYKKLKKVS